MFTKGIASIKAVQGGLLSLSAIDIHTNIPTTRFTPGVSIGTSHHAGFRAISTGMMNMHNTGVQLR